MGDIRLELKLDKFNACLAEMKSRLGDATTSRQLVNYEVGKVLSRTISKTTAATVSSVRASTEEKEWTTYLGKRYRLSWKYPNATWTGISAMRKASLAAKIAAIGLTKQTWLTIGMALGVEVKAPAYVAAAKTPKHDNADNVSAIPKELAAGYGVTIQNRSPLLRVPGLRQPFFGAVAGRIGFYNRNVKYGVFEDLNAVAKKYRGLIITNPAPPADPDA